MNRGKQFGVAAAALALMLTMAGCTSQENQVRPDLGAAQRAEARVTLKRSLPEDFGDGVARIDVAWTDRCAPATNSGFFQPASGTSCAINGVAVYVIGSADSPAEAVRTAATALRTAGATSDDVAAGRIAADGTVAGFDDHGAGTVGIGDTTQDTTFAIASADHQTVLTEPLEDSEVDVVASERGLGSAGRQQALHKSNAKYVLIVTHRDGYFRSLDNAEPAEPAPRPSVPPCYSGSNDCVGG